MGKAGDHHTAAQGTDRHDLQKLQEQLPIANARKQLISLVKAHQTLVLVGETGSGKSTQLPQFLYKAGLAEGKSIAVTQPRRVAATAIARRVAQEMGVQLGAEVGYAVRFDDSSSAGTRIKYMTDGMLVREALIDPSLSRYKVVVLDEAHERTLPTEILFGLMKQIQEQRKGGLKLIVMSATLDAAKFAHFFNGAKVIYLQGRQYPVEMLYLPEPVDSYLDAALRTVLQIHVDEPSGDILVFLTGQDEIETMQRLIPERSLQLEDAESHGKLLVVPIYAALQPEQQAKVFEPTPPGMRKVILATNIAETSITVPGVRYVVDPGFVKARSYNARLGSDSLQVVPISKAQARQRSGRAGREAPGKAFRLYTEAAYLGLQAASAPEIQRVSLASLALQLKQLGVADVRAFPFMDPPPPPALARALELLLALGALDQSGALSKPLGAQLVRLPLEPVFGKVLLSGAAMSCSEEALSVVSMASTDPVFVSSRNKQEAATEMRKQFVSPLGDHITLLNVLTSYMKVKKSERGRWCGERLLNARSLRKALDIRGQLREDLLSLKVALKSCGDDLDPLRRAVLSGLFMHAAILLPDNTYKVIASGQIVSIHPSSILSGRKPRCIVFDELLRTTRNYARNVTVVEPAWLPEVAPIFFQNRGSPGGRGQ
ncbi:ATP-dependent RNA helicase DHX8 [Coccomyxa sp. Obi]|nr:ATP-dependent RNA helicase DHX8 [Coccomyxa sp. Obi]